MGRVNGDVSKVFPRRLKYLSVFVSLLCGCLIVIHAIYPEVTIDTTTIALLMISFFPWLLPYIKSIKFPGGEITFREEVRRLERLSVESAIAEIQFDETSLKPKQIVQPTRASLLEADPNLALASLRIEIEGKLRAIAEKKKVPIRYGRVSAGLILNALHLKQIIASTEFQMLKIIIDACNRAVHAEKVDLVTASQVLHIGESAILYLDSVLR